MLDCFENLTKICEKRQSTATDINPKQKRMVGFCSNQLNRRFIKLTSAGSYKVCDTCASEWAGWYPILPLKVSGTWWVIISGCSWS